MFFSLKMFKIWCRFHKLNKKFRKSFSFLTQVHLSRDRQIVTIQKRILVIGSQCVDKHPYHFKPQYGRCFPTQSPSNSSKKVIEVLSWRFHKCLGHFNMLTVEGCSETTFLERAQTKSLTVCNFENTLAMTILFFKKCLKFDVCYINSRKKSETNFSFLRYLDRKPQVLTIRNIILVIGSPSVNKRP